MQVDQMPAGHQPAITQSGPRGRFGLHLQPPPASYVGTQVAEEYETRRQRSKSVVPPHQSRSGSGPQSLRSPEASTQPSPHPKRALGGQQLRDLFNGSLTDIDSESESLQDDQGKWPRSNDDNGTSRCL